MVQIAVLKKLPGTTVLMFSSAKDVDSHLRLLVAAGAVNRDRAEYALKLFDQVRAMTWRLLNPPSEHGR